jgi:hypothetical protein
MSNKQKYNLIICIFGCITVTKYRNEIFKINETWAEHAKNKSVKLIYFLGEEKPRFETKNEDHIEYVYLPSIKNDYNSATYKQNFGLKYIYDNYECDFVHVCGTDTYILIDNLLNLLKQYDCNDNICLGGHGAYETVQNEKIYFHSGGAGFTLSRKALSSIYILLISSIELWYYLCSPSLKNGCDVLLCYFLQKVGCKMVIIKNKYFSCNHIGIPCCTNYFSRLLDDNANKYNEIVTFHNMTLSNFDELTTFINYNKNNKNSSEIDSEDMYILEKMNSKIPDCTIVSGCYNFSKFNKHARSFDIIKRDIDTLLQVPCYLVMYCDNNCYTYIKEQRNKYGLDDLTKIYVKEFDELYCAQFLNKVIKNREIYYPTKDLRTNEHTHLITCNKFDFVLQTMNDNPFKTSKFAWIDCFLKDNASNICKNYSLDTIPNILNRITNKFHIQILNVCDKKYKLIENKKEYYERYRYVVCGGVFTCGIEIGRKILTRLNQIFVETTNLGYGHGEEMFYLEVLDEFYDDIVRGYGNYDIILNNILEPKENYKYLIQVILKSYIDYNYYREAYDCSKKLLEQLDNNYVYITPDLYFKLIMTHYILIINYKKTEIKDFSLIIKNKYIMNPLLAIEYNKKKDICDNLLSIASD